MENWREIGETVAGRTTFKADLEENHKYRLRVRATNKIGTSEPAELKEPVLARDPWGEKYRSYFDDHDVWFE